MPSIIRTTHVYFITPISAAKLKFIRANPTISFIVDNRDLTLGSCGVMIQGKAKVFSVAKSMINILSLRPKIVQFTKKYPGMFAFYANGKRLPDERKLYKYRLIRVDPTKMIYWTGYNFGRFITKQKTSDKETFGKANDETKNQADSRSASDS